MRYDCIGVRWCCERGEAEEGPAVLRRAIELLSVVCAKVRESEFSAALAPDEFPI